jgi:hypothetical protein
MKKETKIKPKVNPKLKLDLNPIKFEDPCSATPRRGILSANFYTLIGALDSAHFFIDKYYRAQGSDLNLTRMFNAPREGRDAETIMPLPEWNDATKHKHLDPTPLDVAEELKKLKSIKQALLEAEGAFAFALYQALGMGEENQKTARKKAWNDFTEVMTNQTFEFATSVHRLAWDPQKSTGAPEWVMMEGRLKRILKAFALVSRGGGGDEGVAGDWPNILGSSDGSISF